MDKEDLESDYNYHFNREEYEHSRFTEPNSYKDGPFKRNRTLLITLLDISVIVLILIVVLPFVRKSYEVPDLEGYKLKLSHYSSGDQVFLNLSVTNKSKGDSDGADLVDLEFSLEQGEETASLNELLPLPGETLTYRTKFSYDSSESALVKVTIKGISTILRIKLMD
ncbi:MAG: hypothetical protein L3J12_01920 [Spirochaetales bacterium]|nr:hypothetical protein [Spirochaetales bacterium]